MAFSAPGRRGDLVLVFASLFAVTGCGLFLGSGEPPDDVSPDVQLLSVDRVSFSTMSPVFEAVPGANLGLSDPGDGTWLVMASGMLTSTVADGTFSSAEAQVLVNGVERARSGNLNEMAEPVSWMHVFPLETAGEVSITLRAVSGTARISELSVVALRLPPEADLQTSEAPGAALVTSLTMEPVVELDFEPVSAGRYLVLGSASITESPGDHGVQTVLIDPGGAQWPNVAFEVTRPAELPILFARAVQLAAGPQTFHIDAAKTQSDATILNARLIAFRTDVFVEAESKVDLGDRAADCASPVVTTLDLPEADPGRERLVIQAQTVDGSFNDPADRGRVAEFRANGQPIATASRYAVKFPIAPEMTAFVSRGSQALTLENEMRCEGAGPGLTGRESVIHVLGINAP